VGRCSVRCGARLSRGGEHRDGVAYFSENVESCEEPVADLSFLIDELPHLQTEALHSLCRERVGSVVARTQVRRGS
jgi:hypothetical protein